MSNRTIATLSGSGPIALSIAQLATRTSIGRTSIYSEINAGRLPIRKVGRRTVILVDDAVRWLRGSTPLNGGNRK